MRNRWLTASCRAPGSPTPVSGSVALPHLRIDGLKGPRLVIARIRRGLTITMGSAIKERISTVHTIFFLISPQNDPTLHAPAGQARRVRRRGHLRSAVE